ncbi:GNAT family N-acetyltransferase [Saprospira grandis]|uniref:GCN5-related N-acetyltransferase n=1 Tax=Saprospira grandis (strain Lewin) TaxID=984262 RepID=H6L3Y3_SAPGL|nr:GNAT family N-acetyltransferase [Saprospira grandis]AFC23865.1 GCN5-related N-acetyltransferase [Saprospira grandis str. Lewin]
MKNYLFRSARLGFRVWTAADLPELAKMNADLEVMAHFPSPLTEEETAAFLRRLQAHQEKYGYCYFATDILESGEFIGFIGLAYQDYESAYTPAVDIGWRLKKAAWGQGYATEGAKKCLEFAFEELEIEQLIAVCTLDNQKSEQVMKKIGLQKLGEFKHPKLKDYAEHEDCLCYGGSGGDNGLKRKEIKE